MKDQKSSCCEEKEDKFGCLNFRNLARWMYSVAILNTDSLSDRDKKIKMYQWDKKHSRL